MLWFTIYSLAEQLAMSRIVAILLVWVLKRENKSWPTMYTQFEQETTCYLSHWGFWSCLLLQHSSTHPTWYTAEGKPHEQINQTQTLSRVLSGNMHKIHQGRERLSTHLSFLEGWGGDFTEGIRGWRMSRYYQVDMLRKGALDRTLHAEPEGRENIFGKLQGAQFCW